MLYPNCLPRRWQEWRITVWVLALAIVTGAGSAFAGERASSPAPAPVTASPSQAGAIAFQKCAVCHTLSPDGVSSTGPNLYGVVGRGVGKLAGFHFSPALSHAPDLWSAKRIDAFLQNPQAVYPGNRMPFSGIASAEERRAILDYLISKSQ